MPPLIDHLEPRAALDEIRTFLDANQSGYRGAVVQLAAVKDEHGSWQSALWALRAVAAEDPPPVRRECTYLSMRLLQEPLGLDSIKTFLADVFEQGRVLGIDAKLSDVQGNTADRRVQHANNGLGHRAGMAWTLPGANRPHGPHGPLVEFGEPYRASADSAIADWVGIRNWQGSADGRRGSGIVCMPEARAYLASLARTSDTTIEVHVHRSSWFAPRLRIKGTAYDGRTSVVIEADVSDKRVVVPVLEEANELELSLVAEDGSFLDWHREAPGELMGQSRALASATDDGRSGELRSLIDRGEGDRMEFKPFASPGNKKWREILQSVVAFANTGGGTLLVGVDDNGNVTGIEGELAAWAKDRYPPESRREEYARVAKRAIANAVVPVPQVTAQVVPIAGHAIVVLEVPDSSQKPHALIDSHEVFVRRGATDRRITVDEFKRLVVPRSRWPHSPPDGPR